jgi:hypothetical protein
MKKMSLFITVLAALVILVIIYYLLNRIVKEHFSDNGFQWISSGTCASHNLQDLTQGDCSNYFQSSNYTITGADHGPPGCWLVLGDSLNGVLKDNPNFSGKGFGCYSQNKTDGKKCSPDFPCVCK